ncbi:MAG TPA: serine hydrolase [Candidatus Eisenbacteria bacterium]|nr:serine hydrolase [Candidatus Eisenbacteria bacterium]
MQIQLTRLIRFASLLGALAAATGSAPQPFAFPETAAGKHAAAFFPAINEPGDSALRAFLIAHVSAEGLKRRPLEERLEVLGGLREERGRLTPIEVRESSEAALHVIVRAEDGDRLSIRFLCEEAPPHAMVGIRVEDLPGSDQGEAETPAEAGPPMTESAVLTALRAYADSLSRAEAFSGVILLAKDDTPLVREAYGYASREKKSPNRPNTKFNLGSINKSFTRLAIELLAAEGKLNLSDTIDRYVPEYPAELGRKITIAQLLDHRAGVPDIFNDKFQRTDPARLRDTKDWLALIRGEPLRFEPGTSEAYSNGGYVLLGAVIERVTQKSYYDFVRERIYGPAGMKESDTYFREEAVADRADGYTRRFGNGASWKNVKNQRPARGSAAGGGYSTVDDLHRYVLALRAGRFGAASDAGDLAIAGGSPGTNAALLSEGPFTAVVLANQDPPAAERVLSKLRGWLRRAGAGAGGDGEPRRRIRAGGVEAPDRGPKASRIPTAGVGAPMLRSGHLPAVRVRVNGQGPFLFAIDTGGAGTARIDSALAARLGLQTVGEALGGDPSGKNPRRMPLVAVDSIEIGGARFAGITAAVRNYNEMPRGERVDGVLGFGLFAECLFTLDYPAEQVRLRPGALPEANGADILDYRDRHGIPSTTIRVAGREMEADVDAGSMGGIILPESEMGALPLASKPVVVGTARTVSNTFEIRAADLDGDVTIGGITLRHPKLEFQPVFPNANVGSRVLRDYAITFDQKNRRLRLTRPS